MKKPSPTVSIEQLLKDGLAAYGRGEISVAMGHWIDVIRLEPNNKQAEDYIRTASPELHAKVIQLDEHRPASENSFQEHLQELLKERRFQEALVFLSRARRNQPGNHAVIDNQIEGVKAEIVQVRSQTLGSLEQVPELAIPRDAMESHGLSAIELQVANVVDGRTSLEGVAQSMPYERHIVLTALSRCLGDGVLRLQVPKLTTSEIDVAALKRALEEDPSPTQAEMRELTATPNAADDALFEFDADDAPTSDAPANDPPADGARSDDDAFDGLYRKATVAYMQGELDAALTLYQECLALRPTDERVRHNVSRLSEGSE